MLKLKVKIDEFNYCEVLAVVNIKEVRVKLLEVVDEEVIHSVYNAVILKSNIIDYVEVEDDSTNI